MSSAGGGCQWRRDSQVELFAWLGFWFWWGERLAGLTIRGSGGGGWGGGGGAAAWKPSHGAFKLAMTEEPPVTKSPVGMAPVGVPVPNKEEEPKEEEPVEEEPVKAEEVEPAKEEEPDVEELLVQYQDWVDSLLNEGVIDDQFSQLQMLQDEGTPDFVEEVVTLFFDDSKKLLESLSGSLKKDPVDYKVVDGYVHTFKGSSASVGAQRVMKTCITFRHCCDKGDKQGCLDHLVKVKEEFNIYKSKVGKLLELEKRIVAAGGVIPS